MTGVQTCALPISLWLDRGLSNGHRALTPRLRRVPRAVALGCLARGIEEHWQPKSSLVAQRFSSVAPGVGMFKAYSRKPRRRLTACYSMLELIEAFVVETCCCCLTLWLATEPSTLGVLWLDTALELWAQTCCPWFAAYQRRSLRDDWKAGSSPRTPKV